MYSGGVWYPDKVDWDDIENKPAITSGSGVVVEDEGSDLGAVQKLNFVGDSVSVTVLGDTATVTISGTTSTVSGVGSSGIQVLDEGTPLGTAYALDFVGDAVTAALNDGTVTVTVTASTTSGTGDMLKSVYDTNDNGVVDSAESVSWSGITSIPETFPPSAHTHSGYADINHTHDDRYYTETELQTSGLASVHFDNITNVPAFSTVTSLDDLDDVAVSAAISGQYLIYNGVDWIPTTISGGDGHSHLNKSYLDTINQSLATTDMPLFENVRISGLSTNLGSGIYLEETIEAIDYDVYNTHQITSEPTGFPNRTNPITFNQTSKALTISGTYAFYSKGREFTRTNDSIIVDDSSSGLHYIYYDTAGTLSQAYDVWDLTSGNVPVATVYNGGFGDPWIVGEERHGVAMDGATHYWFHTHFGTMYEGGCGAEFSFSWPDFQIAEGIILDEDIRIDVGGSDYGDEWHVFYRQGSDICRNTTTSKTLYLVDEGGLIQYDNGSLADVPNASYVAYWMFAYNGIDYQLFSLPGQRTDNTLANARINNSYLTLSLEGLPSKELKLLYRVLIQRVGTSANLVEVSDFRLSSANIAISTTINDHGLLTGLTDPDHPATAIYTDISNFNGVLSSDNTTVQSALDTLDNIIINSGVLVSYSGVDQGRVQRINFTGPSVNVVTAAGVSTVTISGSTTGSTPSVQTSGHIIQNDLTNMPQRANLSFTGTGVTVTDDLANNRTLITITDTTSSGGSGSGHIISYENTTMTQRATLAFSGAGFVVTDESSLNQTKVTLLSDHDVCNGRLTLASGDPTPSAEQTDKSTLYFTPYKGNRIGLYDGTKWKIYRFTEISGTVSGLGTDGYPADIFVYINGGVLYLAGIAWSSNTARSVALSLVDGVYVRSNDTTWRYVGTIFMDTATTTCDNLLKRMVWNYYNQVLKTAVFSEVATHTYTSTTARPFNNNSSAFIEYVVGLHVNHVYADIRGDIESDGTALTAVGIGVNASNTILGGAGISTKDTARSTGADRVYLSTVNTGYNQLYLTEARFTGGTATYYAGKLTVEVWG